MDDLRRHFDAKKIFDSKMIDIKNYRDLRLKKINSIVFKNEIIEYKKKIFFFEKKIDKRMVEYFDKIEKLDLLEIKKNFQDDIEILKIINSIELKIKKNFTWLLGNSGGMDSAMTIFFLNVYNNFFEKNDDKIIAVNMPSKNNSEKIKNLARKIAQKNIFYEIEIENILKNVQEKIGENFYDENIQSRTRGLILNFLKDFFSKEGKNNYVCLMNNSNLSEIEIGNFTIYGDTIGDFGILRDLYKSEIYILSDWILSDEGKKHIKNNYNFSDENLFSALDEISKIKPTAELKPDQDDSQICLNKDFFYKVTDIILMNRDVEKKKLAILLMKNLDFRKWVSNFFDEDEIKKNDEILFLNYANFAIDVVVNRLNLSNFKNEFL